MKKKPSAKHHYYYPHLSEVVKRNIRTLLEVRHQIESSRSLQDKFADLITGFSGSMTFVFLHMLWFVVWLVWNLGGLQSYGLLPFDPYPFGLLTMIVSLEAIFLSTFVLVSQNRMGAIADQRADLDLHVNLLAEYEVTKLLRIVDEIARHQKVAIRDPELKDLETEVRPEMLLQELHDESKLSQ